MKNTIPIIFLLLLFSCQPQTRTINEKSALSEEMPAGEPTEFEFTEETHNFGILVAGQIVVYLFEFKNTGTENLYIRSAETDCGCVQVSYSEKTILPGDSGIIEVEFNTSGLNGRQLKTIEIHGNTKKPKQLVIFADVKNELFEITN